MSRIHVKLVQQKTVCGTISCGNRCCIGQFFTIGRPLSDIFGVIRTSTGNSDEVSRMHVKLVQQNTVCGTISCGNRCCIGQFFTIGRPLSDILGVIRNVTLGI